MVEQIDLIGGKSEIENAASSIQINAQTYLPIINIIFPLLNGSGCGIGAVESVMIRSGRNGVGLAVLGT